MTSKSESQKWIALLSPQRQLHRAKASIEFEKWRLDAHNCRRVPESGFDLKSISRVCLSSAQTVAGASVSCPPLPLDVSFSPSLHSQAILNPPLCEVCISVCVWWITERQSTAKPLYYSIIPQECVHMLTKNMQTNWQIQAKDTHACDK